ncbi:MAG: ABC transporter ATP-binding protein [Pseudonocardiaceae bacterium]
MSMTATAPTSTATPTPTNTGQLHLEQLCKTFTSRNESTVAVDGIDLTVEPGEFITLLGPSGCGKTTILRIVAGFEYATSGHVRIDGRLLDDVPPQKRPTAMVFQSFALFPHMTVAENIAYGLRLKKLNRTEINEAVTLSLTSMNLAGLGGRSPHELSGGQQQRVALARALVVQPRLLLFDEPLSNLDAKLRASMRAEIRRIQQRLGITSLYVTHDQDEAMSMADRIVVMNKGRIEQVGIPSDIYLRPASVFVADFVGRANFLEVSPREIEGSLAMLSAFGRDISTACHREVQAGRTAYLVVRPESVSLTPTVHGANGVVLNSVFRGTTAEYEIETAVGTLVASVSRPDPTAMLTEGTNVAVEIEDRHSYVLPKQ